MTLATMRLEEYAQHDAVGLAALIAAGEVTAKELALTASAAIEAVNPALNAVVETYRDRIEELDDATLGDGPFRGVPVPDERRGHAGIESPLRDGQSVAGRPQSAARHLFHAHDQSEWTESAGPHQRA